MNDYEVEESLQKLNEYIVQQTSVLKFIFKIKRTNQILRNMTRDVDYRISDLKRRGLWY